MNDKQAIVFAFYKGDKLQGFRTDTLGSIGISPKIYHYSKEQVETVLKNVFYNCEEARKPFADEVTEAAQAAADGNGIAIMFASISKRTAKMVKDLGEFEVRVLPCPDYGGNPQDPMTWVYPTSDILEYLQHPMPESIEVHKFKV